MNITNAKASNPFMFMLVGGMAGGVAYGAVRSFNLSLTANILTMALILCVMYMIFRQGKAKSYAEAQAWAQNEVDIAVEVANTATAKAEALSEAYSTAISQANAQAINEITLNMPNGEPLSIINKETEGLTNETRTAQLSGMAMGELSKEEFTTMWESPDFQKQLHNLVLNWGKLSRTLRLDEMSEPERLRSLLYKNSESPWHLAKGDFYKG